MPIYKDICKCTDYRDVLKIFLSYRLTRYVLMSLSTCGVHEFCREIFKLV